MAVQVGRTVISFTIKYVQSEKEKLKHDISKVLDSKNKNIKAAAIKGPEINNEQNNQGTYNQNYPLHMQQTQYAMNQMPNVPMEGDGIEVNDQEDNAAIDNNDNEPRQMDLN